MSRDSRGMLVLEGTVNGEESFDLESETLLQ